MIQTDILIPVPDKDEGTEARSRRVPTFWYQRPSFYPPPSPSPNARRNSIQISLHHGLSSRPIFEENNVGASTFWGKSTTSTPLWNFYEHVMLSWPLKFSKGKLWHVLLGN